MRVCRHRTLVVALLALSASIEASRVAPPLVSRTAKAKSAKRGRGAPPPPPPPSAVRTSGFARSAVAGGAAAAAATVVFHPVDTVKTVLQQQGASASIARLGVGGLYRGVGPAAMSMMPACAVRMGAYELLKAQLARLEALSAGAQVVGASALSVVVSSAVRSPLDMVKTQVQTGAAPNAAAALRAACRGGGLAAVGGLYRGAGLALLRDVPFFSLNLLVYEGLRVRALAASADGTLSNRESLLIGAVAQGVAGFATNPFDALKTRVQAGAPGVGAALRDVLRADGPRGLMRGAGMRVLWIGPQGSVYYPAYEAVQRLLS